MANTADLAVAREAMATHIYLCEDRLNHAEGYALLDEAMDVAFEVGRNAEKAAAQNKYGRALNEGRKLMASTKRGQRDLAEQYRRADGSMDLPGPGSQYGAQLDKERSEAMKAAGVEYVP